MATHLLIIDPQNDFCDGPANGALPVPGAWDDLNRLAAFVRRAGASLDAIHVTLDAHHPIHIAHPIAWIDGQGRHPEPFTTIAAEDVERGVWRPRDPALRDRYLDYLRRLEGEGGIPHTIWPPHCLIGSTGHAVQPDLFAALREWEEANYAVVDYVAKGSNLHVEHFGALKAQVEDPADPATRLNTALLGRLSGAERLIVAGEALNFCVMTTLRQLAEALPESMRRLVLLRDCTAPVPVPGHEKVVEEFLGELADRGAVIVNSRDYAP